MRTTPEQRQRLALGLLAVGFLSRLLPHPPNVTPILAITFFGAACLPRRWAISLPIAVVALSDVFLGLHTTIPFTWLGCAVTALFSLWVRRNPQIHRLAAGALLSSVSFFLITNFGVWLVGGLYPLKREGLWNCLIAALPFFRNSLIGDLAFTLALFGAYRLLTGPLQQSIGLPDRKPVLSS